MAVGVVLRQDPQTMERRVLVARRPDELHQGGLLEFPGGKVEPDESVEEALCRELAEELSIDISGSVKKPFLQIEHEYSDKTVFLDVWVVDGYQGEPWGREGQEVFHLNLDELNPAEFPAANGDIIHRLQHTFSFF